jgi:hypothetical protein
MRVVGPDGTADTRLGGDGQTVISLSNSMDSAYVSDAATDDLGRLFVSGVTFTEGQERALIARISGPEALLPPGRLPVADFDGNGTTDRSVYRPATGQWFVRGGSPEVVQDGTDGDTAVPADYDGNGSTDRAVYRPATGQWFVQGGSPEVVQYGAAGDQPQPGDYDGNGTVELAIYRPATGQWFVRGGNPEVVQYGADGDIALPLAAATRQAFFPR